MRQCKNLALYELVDGTVLQVYQNRAGDFVVQARGVYNGRYFDTLEKATAYCTMKIKEVEYLVSIESEA